MCSISNRLFAIKVFILLSEGFVSRLTMFLERGVWRLGRIKIFSIFGQLILPANDSIYQDKHLNFVGFWSVWSEEHRVLKPAPNRPRAKKSWGPVLVSLSFLSLLFAAASSKWIPQLFIRSLMLVISGSHLFLDHTFEEDCFHLPSTQILPSFQNHVASLILWVGVPPTETHVFSCFTKPFCYFPLRQSKPYDILVISSAHRSTFLSIVYKFDEPKPSELNQSSFALSLSVFKKFSLVLKNGPRTPIWANHGHQLGSVLRRWIDRWPRGARSQLLEPPGSRAAVREEGLHHAENCN